MHDIHKYNVKIVGSDSKPVAYLDHLLEFYMITAPTAYHRSSKSMKTSKKHDFIKLCSLLLVVSIYTNSNEHNFIKSCFLMFSCILSFDDMPLVLLSYKLRFGTQVPVAEVADFY